MTGLRRGLARLAIACAAGLLLLAGAELAMRALGFAPIYQIYSHPEIFWRKDELLGWSQQSNVEGAYVGPRPWPVEYRGWVRINSLGLRGPEIADLPPDGYRVMVLGDSMVAGFEVPWEETFEALLEARLNDEFDVPIQVINAGVRGYGTDQSFLYYQRRGRHLKPDLVILIYGGNDLSDNVTLHRMRRTFGKGAFALAPGGTLEPVGYPIPDYPICSEWILDSKFRPVRVDTAFERAMCLVQTQLSDHSSLFTFLSMRIREHPMLLQFLYKLGSPSEGAEASVLGFLTGHTRDPHDVAPREKLTSAILVALAREVMKNGSELILSAHDSQEPFADANARGVFAFAITESKRPEYRFKRDGHWNPRGHELMARLLEQPVAERIRARIARANGG